MTEEEKILARFKKYTSTTSAKIYKCKISNKFYFYLKDISVGSVHCEVLTGMKNINMNQKVNATVNFKTKPVDFSKSYFDGFITQILHPKVSIFYIAAFPKIISSV
ncbi:hypothetical protein [Fluviispira sanaruensis]|uniref:Uncharacterized protein n=1 Tax=Fluviispira sanaruensis TaxID=2493639 RepID=A0A4P2VTZ2_FLUSA|nr:hypothetical protein [Fluviispira sanaruensis]BBH52895.1 hypothetical protein JCM31447_13380 [Fluviispira sanaruensis]